MSAFVSLVCERCGRSMKYRRVLDPHLPDWVETLSQSHCDAEDCDTGDRHVERWLDARGVARDPGNTPASQIAGRDPRSLPDAELGPGSTTK